MRRTLTKLAAAAAVAGTLAGCSGVTADGGGSADAPPGPAPGGPRFEHYGVNPEVDTAEDNRSTFALDVDTGSYTVVRGRLRDGSRPDPAAVRTEEFVNYFPQDYPAPRTGMSIHVDGTTAPFAADPDRRVLRIGLQGAVVDDADRQPVNLTFVVDGSGSMSGYKLEMVTSAMRRLVDTLRPDDAVAIATFADEPRLVLPMTPLTRPQEIRTAVDLLTAGGSTNLAGGLRVGYDHARAHLRPDGLNRVVLLSDGVANVGEDDPAALADRIARAAGDDTQLAVVGVGRDTYDDVILERFADRGNGFYSYIDTPREAERLFVHGLTGTLQTVARDAKVQVTFDPRAVASFRLLGFENRRLDHDDLRDDTVDGGEVGAGHTVTALYEVTLSGADGTTPDAGLATVQLRWQDPDTDEPVETAATVTAGDLVEPFSQAPLRLRQDILVAALAESLRGAPWGELVTPGRLADDAEALSRAHGGDEHLAELAELTRLAAGLDG